MLLQPSGGSVGAAGKAALGGRTERSPGEWAALAAAVGSDRKGKVSPLIYAIALASAFVVPLIAFALRAVEVVLRPAARARGLELEALSLARPSLEDVYLDLVGERETRQRRLEATLADVAPRTDHVGPHLDTHVRQNARGPRYLPGASGDRAFAEPQRVAVPST